MVTCNIALKAWLRLQRVQLTVKIESFNNHADNISENVYKNQAHFLVYFFDVGYNEKRTNAMQ